MHAYINIALNKLPSYVRDMLSIWLRPVITATDQYSLIECH